MSKDSDSPNKLTEFGPFITEENKSLSGLFTRWFGVKGTNQNNSSSPSVSSSQGSSTQNVLDEAVSIDNISQDISYNEREKSVSYSLLLILILITKCYNFGFR